MDKHLAMQIRTVMKANWGSFITSQYYQDFDTFAFVCREDFNKINDLHWWPAASRLVQYGVNSSVDELTDEMVEYFHRNPSIFSLVFEPEVPRKINLNDYV